MFPFPASHAIALTQAKRKPTKALPRATDPQPPVRPVKKGVLRRVLDALIDSRRRRVEQEIETRRRTSGVESDR